MEGSIDSTDLGKDFDYILVRWYIIWYFSNAMPLQDLIDNNCELSYILGKDSGVVSIYLHHSFENQFSFTYPGCHLKLMSPV